MECKGEKKPVSFGKTMMEALELQRLAKGISRDKALLKSAKIKPIALPFIDLTTLV